MQVSLLPIGCGSRYEQGKLRPVFWVHVQLFVVPRELLDAPPGLKIGWNGRVNLQNIHKESIIATNDHYARFGSINISNVQPPPGLAGRNQHVSHQAEFLDFEGALPEASCLHQ